MIIVDGGRHSEVVVRLDCSWKILLYKGKTSFDLIRMSHKTKLHDKYNPKLLKIRLKLEQVPINGRKPLFKTKC